MNKIANQRDLKYRVWRNWAIVSLLYGIMGRLNDDEEDNPLWAPFRYDVALPRLGQERHLAAPATAAGGHGDRTEV